MSLEDEPGGEPTAPGAAEDRPKADDLPPEPAAPPRDATSRADKRRNQRRR